jgi:hypothetical protein
MLSHELYLANLCDRFTPAIPIRTNANSWVFFCPKQARKRQEIGKVGPLRFEPTLFGGYMFVMASKMIFTGKLGFESLPRRHFSPRCLSLFWQKELVLALLIPLLISGQKWGAFFTSKTFS